MRISLTVALCFSGRNPPLSNVQPKGQSDETNAAEYIRSNFESFDRIAILVRNAMRRETMQRIGSLERVVSSQFQEWMFYKNDQEGCDIYVGMNALKPAAFRRTKQDILAIRHLYADLDRDGSSSLRAIEKSSLVPTPNYVLNTSPDKYQVIWKVKDMELVQAEALLHALAREFQGDPAATDVARVLRIPGFRNKKYEQDFVVRAERNTDRVYQDQDFKLHSEPFDATHRQPPSSALRPIRSEPRYITQSERDWAYVKKALASGAEPEELITQLADSRANDKSNPEYYARLTVNKALADLRVAHAPTNASRSSDTDDRGTRH
jgi:hypothetical protein